MTDDIGLSVVASCSCRLCGEVYSVVSVGGSTTVADNGLCAVCSIGDSPLFVGSVGTQVLSDLEAVNYFASGAGEYWNEQAFIAWQDAAKDDREEKRFKRQRVKANHVASTETRTCPACWQDFEVEIHARRGRIRDYCCEACSSRHRVSRWRVKRKPGLATVPSGD